MVAAPVSFTGRPIHRLLFVGQYQDNSSGGRDSSNYRYECPVYSAASNGPQRALYSATLTGAFSGFHQTEANQNVS